MPDARAVRFGLHPIGIDDVVAIARGTARVELEDGPEYRAHIERGLELLQRGLDRGDALYGVTTGFGHSSDVPVPREEQRNLPLNLVRFHGAGVGVAFSELEGAAIVAVRLACVARGYSAVRPVLLHGLCDLLNHRVIPRIPSQGSVGASGDLTPLSYVAAVLGGEREVYFRGAETTAVDALREAGLRPLELRPKESLALMNGTSAMTGLACLAHVAARRLCRLTAALTAMAVDAVQGVPDHFDARIFELKAHPGSQRSARWLREDLGWSGPDARPQARLQDRYSLRCAPHVIGVTLDALAGAQPILETEINGVNDNPICDPQSDRVHFGGNFYGGHVCFVMDGLKAAVANLADLLDRQLLLLCDPGTSAGLPANLVGVTGSGATAHFGFKAMQITSSALTAEALKLTMPASVFSRSTENHNQDKVSMGTIAARDCLGILELTETVAAIHLLAACQAVELRGLDRCHDRARALHAAVRRHVPAHSADRRMDTDIHTVLQMLRADALPIGEVSEP